jgi:hypothetical protein
MTVCAVEINGRGVATFNESSFAAARDFVNTTFRHDLKAMIHDRKPLWDGSSELFVREAFPEEQEKWKASQVRALARAKISSEQDRRIRFLVLGMDRAAADRGC